MEKPARTRTVEELSDKVLHWSKELRRAEKEAKYAPEGTRSEANRKYRDIKRRWEEAVDVLLGKMP